MNNLEIEFQEKLIEDIIKHFNNMDEEDKSKLLKVFIQRSLAFETLITGYKQKDKDPEVILKKMGMYGLTAVELYSKIVNLEDEQILYGDK